MTASARIATLLGGTVITRGDTQIDVGDEWPSVRLCDAVSEALGEEVAPRTPVPARSNRRTVGTSAASALAEMMPDA